MSHTNCTTMQLNRPDW